MSQLSWREFRAKLDSDTSRSVRFSAYDDSGKSRRLYRGQPNTDWPLASTLERAGHPTMLLSEYMRACRCARRYLGNHLRFDQPFDENASCKYEGVIFGLPNYEYCAFLRHHGFPSPLLDWSASPYVAAFFAFRNIPHGVERVRIYCYRSEVGNGKGWSNDRPALFLQGPLVAVHERHALQQCWYTLAMREAAGGEVEFCGHDETIRFIQAEHGDLQDAIETFDFAVSEKDTVLADLSAMNITPYTLFRSVDALVETAAAMYLDEGPKAKHNGGEMLPTSNVSGKRSASVRGAAEGGRMGG